MDLPRSLIALSVELQRTNSRMVLERAPESGNLIMSQIAKCEHSVALKKEEAIESLRMESSLKPDRIMNRDRRRPQKRKKKKSSKKITSVGQGYRQGGSGAQKSQLQEIKSQQLKPPPIPDLLDPQELQDRNKEKPVQEVKCLSSVME